MNRFVPSTLIGLLAVGTLISGGALASATTPPPDSSLPGSVPSETTLVAPLPAPVPLSTTTSLPLFGAQLTIDITAGPGGVLASVAVNPADGYTATEVRPNEVVFVNAAGTATVEVKARNGGQRIEATAVSLDDLVAGGGTGGWSGDVFGSGTITTVGFSVVKAADGTPDITGITVSDPSAEIGSVERTDEGVRLAIRFVNGGQSRVLSVRVSVGNDDHGDDHNDEGGAQIRVSLSKLKGVAVAAAEAAGSHTWSGTLCNGSGASITYIVGEDGSISDVVANPAAESSRLDGRSKADVRFSQAERVRIRVGSNDGQIKVSVDEKFRCDSPDPTLNTPVSTTPDEVSDDDHGDDHGDHHGDGKKGDRRDKDKDFTTTTTTIAGSDTTTSAPTDSAPAASNTSGNRRSGGDGGGNGGGGNDGGKGDGGDD